MNVTLLTQGSTILSAEVLSADAGTAVQRAEDSTAAASSADTGASTTSLLGSTLLLPVILLAALYFIIIRPQKKQEKQAESMRSNVQIGDEIVTIGGIVGIVVSKKEDTILIESGGDRNKLRVKTAAISENLTVHEEMERSKTEQAAARAKAKSEKKKKTVE